MKKKRTYGGKKRKAEIIEENEEENEEVPYFNTYDIINENEDENDEENQEIEVQQENLQLEDLKKDDYVIVSLAVEYKKKQKTHLYVAKIKNVDNDESDIGIDYLEQDLDYPQKFKNSNKIRDINKGTELSKIVMLLPEPCKIRGGVMFPRRINLKK